MKQKGILTTLLFSATILHPSYQRTNPLTQALKQFSGALTTLSQRLGQRINYQQPNIPSNQPQYQPQPVNQPRAEQRSHQGFNEPAQSAQKVEVQIQLLNPMLRFQNNSEEMLTGVHNSLYINLGKYSLPENITASNIPENVTITNINDKKQDYGDIRWKGDISIKIVNTQITAKNIDIGETVPTNQQPIKTQNFKIKNFRAGNNLGTNMIQNVVLIEKAKSPQQPQIFTFQNAPNGYYLKAEISGNPKKKDGQSAPNITGEIFVASITEAQAKNLSKTLRANTENLGKNVTASNITIEKDVYGELYDGAYFIGIIQKNASIPGTAISNYQKLFNPTGNFDRRTQLQPNQTFTVDEYFVSKIENGNEIIDGKTKFDSNTRTMKPFYLFPDEAQTPRQTTTQTQATQTETTRTESTSTSSSAELKKYKLSARAYAQDTNVKDKIYLGDIELGTFESNMDAKNLKNLAQNNFNEKMKNSSLSITAASDQANNDYITIQIPNMQNQVNPFNLIVDKEETKFIPNTTYDIINPEKTNLGKLAIHTRTLKEKPKKLILEFDVSEA